MKGQKFMPLLVVAAGLLAYSNSFTGPFIFDDLLSIPENPTIRRLWPIWQALSPPRQLGLRGLTVEGRPLLNLSLAINYALGGYNVWGYHAFNLAIHILAGLTLLGLVRRTLLQPALGERFGAAANELALATAVLWAVHPLQTESVTYIIQRAESIMGLLYLLTLYCFIRGVESPWARLWYGLSVTACALGTATKEVIVTAPVMVLLYDRVFVSGSFRKAWRQRWPLYAALAGTWILQGVVFAIGGKFTSESNNAWNGGITWWEYLTAQPSAILYYLRSSLWPHPLYLDPPWQISQTWVSTLLPMVVVPVLLGASVWAWKTNAVWGFLGAWFFLILAPSSSFIPLFAPISEHRMYLPLAAVAGLVVMGLYAWMGRRSLAVFVALAIGLGFLTWRRNQDYRSEVALRPDLMAGFPNHPAAVCKLGLALQREGRIQEAITYWEQVLRLNPNYVDAHYNLALVLEQAGRTNDAITHFERVLWINPHDAEAHCNLGTALERAGRIEEARGNYQEALRLKPDFVEAQRALARLPAAH
ncbi:MAG TPA: tetratricopeptide repeat protein [Verrucomicrobiae bacterium]|nr:tetratricopeptide repeat protein [Verrucomicrobiae bacterium]